MHLALFFFNYPVLSILIIDYYLTLIFIYALFCLIQHGTCPICRKLLHDVSQDSFAPSNMSSSFMSESSTTNPENEQTTSVSDNDDLSSVSRNYNPHPPSVYDFTDDFDQPSLLDLFLVHTNRASALVFFCLLFISTCQQVKLYGPHYRKVVGSIM